MGQHKYNPKVAMAKNGELPPKEKSISKREAERLLYAKCKEMLCSPFKNVVKEYYS